MRPSRLKFRGKCADTWRYGDHLTYANGDVIKAWNGSMSFEYTVDPETVGQYIDQNDIYGREIYTGTIVLLAGQPYCVRWSQNHAAFVLQDSDYNIRPLKLTLELEVIGNIYDDPELIGVDYVNNVLGRGTTNEK